MLHSSHPIPRLAMPLFLLALCAVAQPAWGQLAYDHFDDWKLVKLKAGVVVCSPYQTDQEAFIEDFDNETLFNSRWDKQAGSNPIQDAFHGSECDNIFAPANVELLPVSPGSSDKTLRLTAKLETQPYTLPGYVNGGWPCLPAGPQTLSTLYTGAAIHLKDGLAFNLGRYEIQCKFPVKDNVWSAFWMWHHDEIDIMDIAYYGKFLQNVFHGSETASLRDAPCCSNFNGCNYCDDIVDHIDCSGFAGCGNCNEQNPQEVPYGCTYLADGAFHTIGCEWTPYKVRFYVDGVTTGTVYRYYKLDRTPLVLECGSNIPEGVYKENPAFPDIKERYFQPIVWIVSEGDNGCLGNEECPTPENCPGAGQCATAADLPATLEVRRLSVHERSYQEVNVSGCFELCKEGDICQQVEVTNLNGVYGQTGSIQHVNPLPTPTISNCQVISKGSGLGSVTSCGPDEICLHYNTNGCTDPGCIGVGMDLVYPPPIGTVPYKRWFIPQEPAVYSQCSNTTVTLRDKPTEPDEQCICIDPGTFCKATVIIEGKSTDVEYDDGLTCFGVNDPCSVIDLFYEACGEIEVKTYDALILNTLLEAMLTPHLITAGSSPLDQGVTYITTSEFDFCYLYDEVGIIQATIVIDGVTQVLNFPPGQCLHLAGVDEYATIEILISVSDCGTFRQFYTFINRSKHYRVTPNPTLGTAVLQIDMTPVDSGDGKDILPQPERLKVMDLNGNLIQDLDISTGATSFPVNLNGRPAGSYQFLVQDKDLPTPLSIPVQKF